MRWYNRVRSAINAAVPFLASTQQTNLALLVSAILKKRTLCLSELARVYPVPKQRRVDAPKHDLLHRLKRLWRFTNNERVDAVAVQLAFLPHTLARLGSPRLVGLAVDWTMFDAALPSGRRMRYQVLRIAVPRKGRALPLLQLAYDRDRLPPERSQNQIEQDALLAVVEALPPGVRPVVLADRGFCRAGFLTWLEYRGIDYVVRLKKGACVTEPDGKRWKLGEEGLKPGQVRWVGGVRYGLHHGRPGSSSSTWPCAGGFRRAARGTPGASTPRSRGTWRRASRTRKAPPTGTGRGAGSSSPSRTPRAASGSRGFGSAARGGFRASWRR